MEEGRLFVEVEPYLKMRITDYKESLKHDHEYLSFVTWLFVESIG